MGDRMRQIEEVRNNEILLSELSEEDRSRNHKLYHALGTFLKGKLLRIVMLCPERNGYEAYRLIIKEVTPQDRARPFALL